MVTLRRSLPVTSVHSYTGDRRLVYRLLYRNLSTERSEDAGAESMRIFKAEVTLNVLQSNQEKPSLENQDETASLDGNQPSDPSTPMNEHVGLEPICWAGRVKELDLLMPNWFVEATSLTLQKSDSQKIAPWI
jgi:hypothetical protein